MESARHGTLREVPEVYYISGRWLVRRHPLTLRRLGAPLGAPGVGQLYRLFFEARPDGTMRTRVCETESAGYAEVEYICTPLSTLFEGVPGCSKMPPVHFWVSPPKRETVRRNGNREVVPCALLLARIMAHWIKEGHYVPPEDLSGVGAGRAWLGLGGGGPGGWVDIQRNTQFRVTALRGLPLLLFVLLPHLILGLPPLFLFGLLPLLLFVLLHPLPPPAKKCAPSNAARRTW